MCLVLIGYWPLNESSGNTAYDYSGNENHGSVKNGGDSTVVAGSQGFLGEQVFRFDGSNDAVDFSQYRDFDCLSVSIWVYFRQDISPVNGNWFGNATDYEGWMFYRDTFYFGNGGSEWIAYPGFGDIPQGKWVNLTFTYDGSTAKTYRDGVLQEKVSGLSGTITSPDITPRLFGPPDGTSWSAGGYVEGDASEVRIYNHALTPREVQYLYTVSERGRSVLGRKSS